MAEPVAVMPTQPSLTGLAVRIALQFSLAYGAASIVLGVFLDWIANQVLAVQLDMWLETYLPEAVLEAVFYDEVVIMIFQSIVLMVANVTLVIALLVPILRWNFRRYSSDLALEFD